MCTCLKTLLFAFVLMCVAGCCTANSEIGRLVTAVKASPTRDEALRYALAIKNRILLIGDEGTERELESALLEICKTSTFLYVLKGGLDSDDRVYSLFEFPDGGIIVFDIVIDKDKLKSCSLCEGASPF